MALRNNSWNKFDFIIENKYNYIHNAIFTPA